jgi:hypothetical protein
MKLTRGQWIALAVSLVMALPALSVGFYADDWIHEARQRGLVARYPPTWTQLFEFARATEITGTPGPREWWAGPEVQVRFFRPLTSITVAIDHQLGALAGHVHGLLWFAALLLLAAVFLRRILPEREATIATFIYAMGQHHAATYTWISGRTSALVGVLSLLALNAHARDRDRGSARSWLGAALYVGALCAGEGSLGALAWLVAFECIFAGERRESLTLRSLVRSLGAYAAITLAYFPFYVLAGYGTRGSSAYRNPITDPIAFVKTAPERVAMLVGDAFTGAPSDFHTITEGAYKASVALGVIVTVAFVALFARARSRVDAMDRTRLDALALGFFGAMAPGLGAPPGGRVIVLAAMASSSMLAMLFVRARDHWKTERSWRARSALFAIGLFHFALAPLLRLVQPAALRAVVRSHEQLVERSQLAPHCRAGDEVLLVSAPDPIAGLYANVTWAVLRPNDRRLLRVLTAAPADHELARVDERTIELSPIATVFLEHPLERLVLDPRFPVVMGRDYPLRRMRPGAPLPGEATDQAMVRVVAMDRGRPSRIRVQFERAIERLPVCFATGFAGAVRAIPVPAVGERVRLRYAPGAMGI